MKKGSILIGAILLLVGLLAVGISISSAVLATTVKVNKSFQSISALSFAEAGVNKALWDLNQAGSTYTGELDNISLPGGSFDVAVNTISSNVKQVTAIGYVPNKDDYRTKKIVRVKISDKPSVNGIAFNYGIQAGPLGVTMSNNAVVHGNVYSEGALLGQNNSVITGDVISSGPSGLIDTAKISGNAKAHTIIKATISKDAYYQHISASTVAGTQHPNSVDPANIALPLSENTISDWEQRAVSGGTYEGNLIIDGITSTLGPKKIHGNLEVTNGAVLTMTGTLWVTGNITFSNNAVIQMDADYGTNSGLIIADNPSDRSILGKINVSNNVQILGSGNPKSYVMLLSTNEGATISDPAIIAGNNSSAVIYYSMTGMLEVSQNAKLRAITGGGIYLYNGAEVEYDIGLASCEFSGGPGGSWVIVEWQELH